MPEFDQKKAQDALDAITEYGTQVAAAQALGISRQAMQNRLRTATTLGLKPSPGVADRPMKSLSPDASESGMVSTLRRQITRLESDLKARSKVETDADIIRGIIGALARKIDGTEIPEWVTVSRGKESSPGVPTLFLSDLHWGERVFPEQINGVNKYNLAIARERLHTCIDSAIHLLKIISPKMDYPGIVVPLGGDMISGNIHEELTATNELNTMPTVLDLYSELVSAIQKLADTFGRVFLPCVTGNHGRDTRKVWAKDRHATSFDWLLYQFLAKRFDQDKRVTFYIPDGSDAYYRVYSTRYLLTHGDQFRGGDGVIGALGPIIRGDHRKRSRNAQIAMEYDTMLMGHWHQYIHMERLIANGSTKGYDEYAYANNFPFESPRQALWLTHPKFKITFRMPVYVDRQRSVAKTEWVGVPK